MSMAQLDNVEGILVGNLCALLESGHGADVVLVVGGSELAAHSHILAARSPVFAAMLSHDTEEARSRRVVVTDVREAVLRQLLYFMYTDTAPQLDSMAPELLPASDKYDLPRLKKWCEWAIAQRLTVDNAGAAAVLAELHSCPRLKTSAVDFMRAHPEVLSTDGWVNAMRGSVEAAVEICRLLGAAMSSEPATGTRIQSKEQEENLREKFLEAASEGRVKEMQALLEARAALVEEEVTALHEAAANSRAAIVKLLIDAGADVSARDDYNRTPLHEAACKNNLHVTWLLLAEFAHKDAQDHNGDTPLHYAVIRNPEQVKALLLAGANRYIQNNEGDTPRDMTISPYTRQLLDAY